MDNGGSWLPRFTERRKPSSREIYGRLIFVAKDLALSAVRFAPQPTTTVDSQIFFALVSSKFLTWSKRALKRLSSPSSCAIRRDVVKANKLGLLSREFNP